MIQLKVRRVGNSLGVVLPKAVTARLNVAEGETLYLTEAPEGGYRFTPYNPEFDRQMTLAESIMHEDRDVLRRLAK